MTHHQSPEKNFPPKLADHILQWYCHPDLLEEIQGDLYEHYHKNVEQLGPQRAKLIYYWLVLRFFKPSNIKNLYPKITFIMWQNYFKTAIRNMVKQKGFTLMNVVGLTIGLATAILIFLWVQDELSYDRFHENGSELFVVHRNMYLEGGQIVTTSAIPKPLEAELENDYPEIESADMISWEENFVIAHEQASFRANGHYVGESYFTNLTHPFIVGNPQTAFKDKNSIVLSDQLAKRLFGENWRYEGNVLGKVVKVGINGFRDMTVSGVFEDMPVNSSLRFEFALADQLYFQENSWVESWSNNGFRMIVKTRPGTDPAQLNAKIKNIINSHVPEERADVFLYPYLDRHLYSEFENGVVAGGRIEYVRIFFFVAIFILIIASINYMSLATARSSSRAKEVGIRKTIGARKSDLIRQFIGESTITAALSMILAIVIVLLLLPYFNNLTDKALKIEWGQPMIWGGLVGLLLIVGLISGIYPAFFLSGSPINKVIKGALKSGSGFSNVRRGLVVLQFVLSTFLIIGTYTCYRQIQYIKNKNLGYNKENVVYFPLEGTMIDKFDTFKERALKEDNILNMTVGFNPPTSISRSTGGVIWDGRDPNSDIEMSVAIADYDYVETLKMELLAGRLHSKDYKLDSANLVINETAAEIMGMENPIGENVSMWGRDGKIIGLVKDFHFSSMYNPIEPLVIRLDKPSVGYVFARIAGGETQEGLTYLESLAEEMNPEFPFTYNFLDDTYQATYRSETIVASLAGYFTLIAICISCLGLFGLALFSAERRHKEISIRKVLGASVSSIILLLSREFLILVMVAILIAIPIAWYGVNIWLSDFTYRISLGMGIFMVSALLIFGVAMVTVCAEAFRAALTNPVEALKSE